MFIHMKFILILRARKKLMVYIERNFLFETQIFVLNVTMFYRNRISYRQIEILYLGIIIYKIAILTINEPRIFDNLINQMYLYKILAHVMIHFMSIIAIEFFMRHDKIFFLCHLCAKSKVYMFGLLWSTHLTKIFCSLQASPQSFQMMSCHANFHSGEL